MAAGLTVSPGSLSFGSVAVGQSIAASVTLTNASSTAITVQQLSIAGGSFSVIGTTLPVTIPAAGSYTLQLQFTPTSAGAATGALTVNTNAASNGSAIVDLSGTGMLALEASAPTAVLNGLSCSSGSVTGAGTDNCAATLSAPAGAGGMTVNLTSSSAAVTVPAAITIPANSTTASFSATIAAVSSAQTVTLTADANGVDASTSIQLDAAAGDLIASVTSLKFGDVAVGSSASETLILTSTGIEPVTITQAALTGAGFTDSGFALPVVLYPNQELVVTVTFDPASAGSSAGQLRIVSSAASGSTINVNLSGTGTQESSGSGAGSGASAPALSGLSCASSSYAGAGTIQCTVTLSGAAPAGGTAVALASSNSAVVIPGSVTVASGATSAAFAATVSAVSSAQTAVLTATANGISQNFSLQLNTGGALLSVNATSVAFGSVSLNSPATQSVVLASVGTLPVTVSGITITGLGFSLTNGVSPLTLNPGQTATLNVGFDPTLLGLQSGTLTITSNATNGATVTVSLSGTGASSTSYAVDLSWDAPASSTDPVAGYNVYRSAGGGPYQLLNGSTNLPTSYVDSTVQSGVAYVYYVTSVDNSGVESGPSNSWSATIP